MDMDKKIKVCGPRGLGTLRTGLAWVFIDEKEKAGKPTTFREGVTEANAAVAEVKKKIESGECVEVSPQEVLEAYRTKKMNNEIKRKLSADTGVKPKTA